MKINVIMKCLVFIFCVQLLTMSTLSVENKVSSSTEKNLVDHATTVADIDPEEGGGKTLADDQLGKNMMIVNSKKSQGKSGSGGGNNAVHGENKNDAASTSLPPSDLTSFTISVCFSTLSLLALSF